MSKMMIPMIKHILIFMSFHHICVCGGGRRTEKTGFADHVKTRVRTDHARVTFLPLLPPHSHNTREAAQTKMAIKKRKALQPNDVDPNVSDKIEDFVMRFKESRIPLFSDEVRLHVYLQTVCDSADSSLLY
jgi:hypothetical protein